MMIRIKLTPEAREEVERTFKTTPDRRLRERCQAVLMADRGRRRGPIAEDLGVHRASVHRWLRAYQAGGLAGLRIRWAVGPPPRIPEDRAATIVTWVKEGPQGCGLERANWPMPSWRRTCTTCTASRCARRPCGRSAAATASGPTGRPTATCAAIPRAKRRHGRTWRDSKKAEHGECVLLSQDEARFPLVPTLRATLGVKGHRPRVGTWDNKGQVYCFAALNLVSGRLTTRLLDNPARVQAVTGRSKVSRLQAAFAAHLRDIARAYPAARHPRVVVVIDNAAWHRGAPVSQVLAEQPHLTLYRLPSYSPHLNTVERLWRVLRRRATHNRLFATMAALRRALRASLCYYQTLRHKVRSLIRAPKNVAQSAAA